MTFREISCQVQAIDTHSANSVRGPVFGAVGIVNSKRSFHGEPLLEETDPSSPGGWYYHTPSPTRVRAHTHTHMHLRQARAGRFPKCQAMGCAGT